MKIAMWSGPRNLSTAMMYSFGARDDCAIWDEPFYAAYLKKTALIHPMRDKILANGEQDAAKVAARCIGEHPDGKPHFYQKHMTHHMIDGVGRTWMKQVKNVFLIRHPARVIASYAAKRENPTLDDIGFWQQSQIFKQVENPIVIDSHDIRENPRAMLTALCDALDLPFQDSMLNWPKGPHPDDGAWAPHWYGAVHNSTGFAGAEGPLPETEEHLKPVLVQAMPYYEEMKKWKLTI